MLPIKEISLIQINKENDKAMADSAEKMEELDQQELVKLVIDFFHRTMVHHTLWFKEVEHQMGMAKALDVLGAVWDKSSTLQMKRLAEVFGFELENGAPKALAAMPKEKLLQVIGDLGKNWIANDGIWFQEVENRDNLFDAKRCNDSCWTRFSPFEAWSIKRFLKLPEYPGLPGLKKALGFRLYAGINVQTTIEEGTNSLLFQMNNCRVQAARKNRGLADYPCKSAGIVEYGAFASQIDPRIKTTCVACPPDEHPQEWFCAWRFTIEEP
jgi:hypothetical protein